MAGDNNIKSNDNGPAASVFGLQWSRFTTDSKAKGKGNETPATGREGRRAPPLGHI